VSAADGIPLLVIVGPTAVGKTEIALLVAEAVGGEIVSADSMAIYRGMDIATAKPTPQQRARVPFHMIDVVDPTEAYTVAQFQEDADRTIEAIHARGRLPMLVGGTGLYVQAVVERLMFPPGPADSETRRRLEETAKRLGSAALHERLRAVDPASAERIHPRDAKRVIRALEVFELTGRPMSAERAVDETPRIRYNAAQFAIDRPRDRLYERINRRVDSMFERGLVEEVQRLRQAGVPESAQSMQALGARQVLGHLRGELSLPEAIELTKRETRRYAKRQLTWFRRHGRLRWLQVEGEAGVEEVAAAIAAGAKQQAGTARSAPAQPQPSVGGR
jgi:tRNA dimethylallyltransferase